ncbi:MAG: hypothetical protein KJ899_15420 [Gammaproteobacteria bacterium]|nr:hypothetical protein [Gammaproteobacteria bacterium]
MKKVLPYKNIPAVAVSILEDRVYLELPFSRLAKKHKMSIDKVHEIINSPAYREYVIYLKREKQYLIRGKYNKLALASYRAIKEILATDHVVDVIDERSNTVIGKKVSADVMKIKEKVASDILMNVGAKKDSTKKGPMFQINNVNGKDRDREILEANRKQEIANLLDSCVVVEAKQIT